MALRFSLYIFCIICLLSCEENDDSCPIGFAGPSCEDQLSPTSIKIESIDIVSIPPLMPNGQPWGDGISVDLVLIIDFLGGPDSEIIYESEIKTDSNIGETQRFDLSRNNVFLDQPLKRYQVRILNNVNGANSTIGSASFIPHNPEDGFPELRKISTLNNRGSFCIRYSYRF